MAAAAGACLNAASRPSPFSPMLDSTAPAREAAALGSAPPEPVVRHFRQILLWPLRLMQPEDDTRDAGTPWVRLAAQPGSPWREAADVDGGEAGRFEERHYRELLSFLPYVQRFLYGEGGEERGAPDAPMRVLRRDDVARLRVQPRPDAAPLELEVVQLGLHFFYDVDVIVLALEVTADALPLGLAQELLYRLGRAYPSGWDAGGRPLHDLHRVEWLDAAGCVLAASDCERREAYLDFVGRHRAPRIAAHWAWLLEPMTADRGAGAAGGCALRYRQIETHRMPVMGYLALDDPLALTRGDFVRLGLVTGSEGPAPGGPALPYAAQHLADFEPRYCYDRFWADAGPAPNTRYLCSGHALVVVGEAGSAFYACGERGVLAQFRHQHFLLFLIAHFQKAALLMFSDGLVEALRRLRVDDAASVRQFKRAIRGSFEGFLRFTHRYWFHEVSEQTQMRGLFQLCAGHLGIDPLYAEVRERIAEMNAYLDADSLRRQANTVVRLTVVTIFGLIGTVTTGFLGMNLLALADEPLGRRIVYFGATFAATIALTVYTIVKSKRLSDWLDALSDERLPSLAKLKVLVDVWRQPRH
jgi:hypothetical protein